MAEAREAHLGDGEKAAEAAPRPSGSVDFSGLKRAHAQPMRTAQRDELEEQFKVQPRHCE